MKTSTVLGFAAAMALGGIASAGINPVGPFTGDYSEGFEGNQVIFLPCMPDRVFSATADLCTPGNSGCHTTTGWGFYCSIYPHSGTWFFGSAGGYAEYTFDNPVGAFGGYFGTNADSNDGWVEIYDADDNLLGNMSVTAPADCTWTWNGWETDGAAIARVATYGNAYQGPFLMQDDMEYTNFGGGADFTLDITGDCNTSFDVSISNGAAGAKCAFAWGTTAGSTPVPPCPGLTVDINKADAWRSYPSDVLFVHLDGSGNFSFNKSGGPAFCGKLVQVVDLDNCVKTNVDVVP